MHSKKDPCKISKIIYVHSIIYLLGRISVLLLLRCLYCDGMCRYRQFTRNSGVGFLLCFFCPSPSLSRKSFRKENCIGSSVIHLLFQPVARNLQSRTINDCSGHQRKVFLLGQQAFFCLFQSCWSDWRVWRPFSKREETLSTQQTRSS